MQKARIVDPIGSRGELKEIMLKLPALRAWRIRITVQRFGRRLIRSGSL